MRPSARYDIGDGEDVLPGRKRLLEAHSKTGSWERVSKELGINFRYVWNFAVNGKLPRNSTIRKKLVGSKTINEILSKNRIQDMPIPLLRWAMENRIECSSDVGTVQEDVTDSPNGMAYSDA